MRLRSWLDPSLPRERLLMGLGFLALGLVLARSAIVAPASDCPRRSFAAGGDEIPGFCADYGDPLGWPALAAGLLCLALSVSLLSRAAGGTRFATTLRMALALAAAGGALLYVAWSLGSTGVCVGIESSGGGASLGPLCSREARPWQPWAYGGGGFLLGAAAALATGVAVRASPSIVSRSSS